MNLLVVTITCDRLPVTRKWIGSLRTKAGTDFRHVVVDNGSQDGTPDWLEAEGYEVVRLPRNAGVIRGWLTGWRHVTSRRWYPDYVIKYDDDCEVVTDNILQQILSFHESSTGRYVSAPRNLDMLPGWEPKNVNPTRSWRQWTVRPVTHVGGLFVMVPSAAFNLLLRETPEGDNTRGALWRRHGWQPVYLDNLQVIHHGRGTSGERKYLY